MNGEDLPEAIPEVGFKIPSRLAYKIFLFSEVTFLSAVTLGATEGGAWLLTGNTVPADLVIPISLCVGGLRTFILHNR